jgi:SAM-dependent methyltransferase
MRDFRFEIPARGRRLAQLQVTKSAEDPSWYLERSRRDFQAVAPHLGRPRRVLDLGCGLGRMSVFVNAQLADPEVEYVLADTSEVTRQSNRNGWDPGEEFYNDLRLTAEFARLNGLSNFRTFDVRRDDWSQLYEVDLVMSFLAVGFHFPIEGELERLLRVAAPHCAMIFSVREGRYDERAFRDRFETVELVGMDFGDSRYEYLVLRR